jgi:adenosine deaminase
MEEFYSKAVQPAVLQHADSNAATPLLHGEAPPAALLATLRRVPKTDFHCHLNGSITPALLAHMERLLLQEHRRRSHDDCGAAADASSAITEKVEESHVLFFNTQEKRVRNVLVSPTAADAAAPFPRASASHSTPKDRMKYCFSVFDAIYKIMTNLAFTRLAVQDMLLCSAAENIAMMEIRTSLRDGLLRTFRLTGSAADDEADVEKADVEAGMVSKQEYVDTVIHTVEHLLSGGLVDFDSGELLSMEASATVVANPQCSTESMGNDTTAGVVPRWWRVFDRVYGGVLAQEMPPSEAERYHDNHGEGTTLPAPVPRTSADPLSPRLFFVRVVRDNWMRRLHVRLLLSINRGAEEEAAWAAAELTTLTQRRQVRAFHAWCCACHCPHNKTENSSSVAPSDVFDKLRKTCWVTGVDLSGNCYKGTYTTFNAPLDAARKGTVRSEEEGAAATAASKVSTTAAVTLHGGEKLDTAELAAMVAFAPERWGHLVFTDDDNLSTILAAHQGIELCLTSNLLTSGHADVAEHHLGHLVELWDRMPESRATLQNGEEGEKTPARLSKGCLIATLQRRNDARVRFAERPYANAEKEADEDIKSGGNNHRRRVTCSGRHNNTVVPEGGVDANTTYYVLPNISFHTDDRGVFGTTLSNELLLASQHPAVRRLCERLTGVTTMTVATTTEFFWWLERLSVTQLFHLPLPVQLLAALLTEGQRSVKALSTDNNSEDDADDSASVHRRQAYESALLLVSEFAATPTHAAWQDWDTFMQMCAKVTSAHGYNRLPSRLSTWECTWLYDEFDHYYSHS